MPWRALLSSTRKIHRKKPAPGSFRKVFRNSSQWGMGRNKDNPANLAAKEWGNVVCYVFMYSESEYFFLFCPSLTTTPRSEQILRRFTMGKWRARKIWKQLNFLNFPFRNIRIHSVVGICYKYVCPPSALLPFANKKWLWCVTTIPPLMLSLSSS